MQNTSFLARYGFLIGVISVITLAALFPEPGMKGGAFHSEYTKMLAVFSVFLIQGFSLPTEVLRKNLKQWRLHHFVQGTLFGLFPLIIGTFLFFSEQFFPFEIDLGLCFLAFLPTTLSACIVFVDQAGGNRAGGLVNVVLANTLGMLYAVLISAFLMGKLSSWHLLEPLVKRVFFLLILPLSIGQVLHFFCGSWAMARRKLLKRVCSCAILFIIYCSFAQNIRLFLGEGLFLVTRVVIAVTFLWFVINIIVAWAAERMEYSYEDRVAAFFCGTHKTLAAGIPLADAVFMGLGYNMGLIILPLMVYHFLELSLGGIWVGRLLKSRRHAPVEQACDSQKVTLSKVS